MMKDTFSKSHVRKRLLLTFVLFLLCLVLQACDRNNSRTDADIQGSDAGDADFESADTDESEEDGDISDGDQDGDGDEPTELVWGPCDTSDWPDGFPLPAFGVECALIEAPFEHENPGEETFEITVARHPARTDPGQEAVFIIAGGPGGTSVGESGLMHQVIPDVLDRFDLVYVDQRGTGGSGALHCPTSINTIGDLIACGDFHDDKDLNHYLSLDAAHDFDLVRRLLGYERISLIGGSYGARLALEYVRRYEEFVQMVILAGIIAPDTDWLGEGVTFFSRAMASLIEECNASAECLEVSPTFESDALSRREELVNTPRPINIQGFGVMEEDEWLFLYFLSGLISDIRTRFRIPRAIHEAVNGDNSRWNELISEIIGRRVTDVSSFPSGFRSFVHDIRLPRRPPMLGDFVSQGLYQTILCAEFLPNSPGVDRLWELVDEQTWPDDSLPFFASGCSGWDVDPIDVSLRQAVRSDVPTLLMSGEFDINTIPEWGDHVAETMTNNHHIVVPYATHYSLWTECPSQIVSDYLLSDGEMSAVDTSCLEALEHPGW